MSQIGPLRITEEPPTSARIGCALVILVQLVALVTMLAAWYVAYVGVDWYLQTRANPLRSDLVDAYMKGAHPELYTIPTLEISVVIGLLIFIVIASYYESRRILIWLKVR